MHNYLPGRFYKAIRNFEWDAGPKPPEDIAELLIQALNAHSPDQVQALYRDDAVHITSERTVQGKIAIKSWFSSLLTQVLPEATFNLAGFSGTGSIRHVNWTANSTLGDVQNGRDTLGLLDGKIAYHFSEFTVSK